MANKKKSNISDNGLEESNISDYGLNTSGVFTKPDIALSITTKKIQAKIMVALATDGLWRSAYSYALKFKSLAESTSLPQERWEGIADKNTAIYKECKHLITSLKRESIDIEFYKKDLQPVYDFIENFEAVGSDNESTTKKGIGVLLGDTGMLNKTIVEKFQNASANKTQPTFDNVLLQEIIVDPNQPRHYFNERDMDELIDSIRENGVLQPILLRPTSDKKYMIVCGERRWRASSAVAIAFKQRNTIPAIIREMTDAEALEAQIIENLQRKDVQPMEEAVAFKSLLAKKQMDVKEIALRVGKSPSYVALRIQLNYLIPEFQEMLSQNKTDLQTAQKLSRATAELQAAILKDRTEYSKNWRKDDNFSLGNVNWFLQKGSVNLSEATFKLSDKNIYPEGGACTTCKFNTANSPLLFEDVKGKQCNNLTCFNIKTEAAYKKKVEEVINDPKVVPILPLYYSGEKDEMKIGVFKEMGITVLPSNSYSIAKLPEEPEHPGKTLEEFNKDSVFEYEDDEDARADYEEALQDYEAEMEEYKSELEEYNTAKENGFIKGFMVCGNDSGKMFDIIVAEEKNDLAGVSDNAVDQIEKILDREKRAKELDQEKVLARVKEELPKLDSFINEVSELNGSTIAAAMLVVFDYLGTSDTKDIRQDLGLPDYGDWNQVEAYKKLSSIENKQAFLNKLLRRAILSRFITASDINADKSGKAAAIYNLAVEVMPERVAIFNQEQEEKAEKRIKGVDKRIADLKKQSTVPEASEV